MELGNIGNLFLGGKNCQPKTLEGYAWGMSVLSFGCLRVSLGHFFGANGVNTAFSRLVQTQGGILGAMLGGLCQAHVGPCIGPFLALLRRCWATHGLC